MRNLKLLLLLVIPYIAIASGGGEGEVHHVASVKDVIWPAFNFCVLFGFLGWKLRNPVRKAFTRNAEIVEEIYVQAEKEANEAAARIEMVQAKMDSFEKVREEIEQTLNKEYETFSQKIEDDTHNQISKMKSDNVQKVEYEKLQLTQDLNAEIIDQIIEKTKSTIAHDEKLRSNVTSKLLSGLQ